MRLLVAVRLLTGIVCLRFLVHAGGRWIKQSSKVAETISKERLL